MIQIDTTRRRLLAALVLLQAILIYVRVRKSSLFSDDFLNFEIFKEQGFTISYLFRDVFGQVAPGYRLAQGVVLDLFGASYLATATIIAALSITSTLLVAGIASRLGAKNWAIGAGLLVFIGLPQFAQTQQWWAAAVHTIFSLTSILACTYSLAGKSKRRVLIASVWYAVALCFTAKVVCSPVIFAAVVFYREMLEDENGGRALRTTAIELVPIAMLTALYLAGLSLLGPHLGNPHPTPSVLGQYLWDHLSSGVVAGALGADSWGLDLPRWIPLLALIVFAVATSIRKKNVVWLWLATLTYIIASGAIIAWNRAGLIPDAGATLRYGVEGASFTVLTAIVAGSAPSVRRGAKLASVVFGLLVLVNVQAHLRSHVLITYPIRETRTYLGHLKSSVKELEGRSDVVVLEGTLPDFVMPSWMMPFGTVSRFLPLYSKLPVGDAAHATHELGTDGVVRPRLAQAP
jgi:hypothetical protein